MNPKNGRPYNQLAVVSFYGRRKLDAVYYYMRSLMSSNPLQSAREPLLSMFDDNRKKWESGHRPTPTLEQRNHAADKEGVSVKGRTRREIWIRPDGGKRMLRTTSAAHSNRHTQDGAADSEDEQVEAQLKSMSYVDLNKRFCVSFLHVHGKLFTKVGMESFQEAGLAMLREFRVLLQHSPLPLTVTRFLQLLALNMFAIENTRLKNTDLEPGYRSATQECALIVSLQMFNLIVERCVQLLRDSAANHTEPTPISNLTSDVHVLLPAIKVWCDWLLIHSRVWNPPPSCRDYRVGPSGDAWTRLATLVNLLDKFNTHRDFLSTEQLPDSELVRLPEDVTLSGFTPLMYNTHDPIYTNGNCDMELAQISLRIHKIMFFGTEFLCGVDPPVLKLQKYETGVSEYVSVVEIPSPPVQSDNEEVCIESGDESEDEDEEEKEEVAEGESDDSGKATGVEEEAESSSLEITKLRKRKEQLERSHRKQERRRQKVQAILRECEKTVEMEVRPHYLVPDTNCLIDYLPQLATIANAKSSPTNEYIYSLIVPLVVINELEGLSQGAGGKVVKGGGGVGAQHSAMVAEAARSALHFLRLPGPPTIKGLTTHGNTLNSNRFTAEEDYSEDMKNDDKILTACLNLSRLNSKESKSQKEDGSRRVLCEVVLLTEDRNLKLKALARDMPVSDMPNFIKWAGLLGLG
ncbi:telomerase-binding protein EST1A isoform X2 [Nilaparvata lugens]|uniref:telomerase-binding protein EST1A isoform X2 n=1 Tax=Nilaparvata lugens TaxID=108931 RepID=UPI00193CAE97|nr:telomerase-binding protein EST1A isoform X2 [Nilaparvata lugens]